MNDPDELERRYVDLTVEGVLLYGDDPRRIRRHVDGKLAAWSERDRDSLRQRLALKASPPSLATRPPGATVN